MEYLNIFIIDFLGHQVSVTKEPM